MVIKEQASSAYKLSAYFMSKFLSELPLNLLGPAIFGTLLFWIVDCASAGLSLLCMHRPHTRSVSFIHLFITPTPITYIQTVSHSPPQYGLFLATLGMTALTSVAMGILISTAAPTIEVAASLGVRGMCYVDGYTIRWLVVHHIDVCIHPFYPLSIVVAAAQHYLPHLFGRAY